MAHTFVIFGASGDLTSRKLIPGPLPAAPQEAPAGRHADRRLLADAVHARRLAERAGRDRPPSSPATISTQDLWAEFAARIFYHAGDIGQPDDFDQLAKFLDDLEKDPDSTRIYYLATAPQFYEPAVAQLGRSGLADENTCRRRVIVSKSRSAPTSRRPRS